MKRRVFITGIGVRSPLGHGIEKVWSEIRAGKSGISSLNQKGVSAMEAEGGEIRDAPDIAPFLKFKKDRKYLTRGAEWAVGAAGDAKRDREERRGGEDRGYTPAGPVRDEETGLYMGIPLEPCEGEDVIPGILSSVRGGRIDIDLLGSLGFSRLPPIHPLKTLPSLIAFHVARNLGLNVVGDNATFSWDDAAGGQAIGEGVNAVREGYCKLVYAGSADSWVSFPAHVNRMRLGHPGIPGEGSAFLTLEPEMEDTEGEKRRFKYAEVAGYSSASLSEYMDHSGWKKGSGKSSRDPVVNQVVLAIASQFSLSQGMKPNLHRERGVNATGLACSAASCIRRAFEDAGVEKGEGAEVEIDFVTLCTPPAGGRGVREGAQPHPAGFRDHHPLSMPGLPDDRRIPFVQYQGGTGDLFTASMPFSVALSAYSLLRGEVPLPKGHPWREGSSSLPSFQLKGRRGGGERGALIAGISENGLFCCIILKGGL